MNNLRRSAGTFRGFVPLTLKRPAFVITKTSLRRATGVFSAGVFSATVLLHTGAVFGQSVLPIAPQPADLPVPTLFTVRTVSYQALPPNDHYSSSLLAVGEGKAFGQNAGAEFLYDFDTPDDLTLNFWLPIQLQYGDAPQTVLAVDRASGAYVGQSIRGFGFTVAADGTFQVDTGIPTLTQPLGLNRFFGGYQSVMTGISDDRAVGTATYLIHTQMPLSGGDGTVISGPSLFFQFPVFGSGEPVDLSLKVEGLFTRVRGFRGNLIVGDSTTNINYNSSDSSPGPWNSFSSAWMIDTSQPGSGRLLAGIPSLATATDGSREGGWVGLKDGTGNYHATLWSGSEVTAVDLNPPGFFDSRVTGMSSEFQVGDGWLGGPAFTPGAVRHALLWRGSAESVTDLNPLLPPSISGAEINGADAQGLIIGSYSLPNFQQLGFIMTPNPALSVASFSVDSSTPAPGGSVLATVSLGAPAVAGGVSVNFTTSDASLIPASTDIFIPEGQTSSSFELATSPGTVTRFMTGPAAVTLVAHTAYTSRSATLVVTPVPATSPIASLTLSPPRVTPGDVINGIVTLAGPAPSEGVVVNFNSGDSAIVPTPASFVIPAGASSGAFNFTATDANPLFFGAVPVVLQAETGTTVQQATVSVARVLKPNMVVLGGPQNAVTTVPGGISGVGFVALNAAAPVDSIILLSNSNPALSLPQSVTVPARTWTAILPWTSLPVATLTTGIAIASVNGFTSTNSLTVTATPPPSLQSVTIPVVSPSQTFSSGDTLTGTVTLSGPAFLGGMNITLGSDTPAAVQLPANVAVQGGATSASFSVVANPVAGPTPVTITATLAGFPTRSALLTVIPGPTLTLTSYNLAPFTTIGPGAVTTGTVTLNQPAPAGGLTLALSASNPQPAKFPATVTIPQGRISGNFTVQGNSVSAPGTTSLIASYTGALAPLGTSVSTALTVAPTDTLHVTKATWSKSTQLLTVTATSTNPQAVLNVLNASGNVLLGTMNNQGNASYAFQMNIASIASVNLKSNLGGATGQGVTQLP